MEVLTKAHAAGCQLVDLELPERTEVEGGSHHTLAQPRRTDFVVHDFRGTRKLDETLEQMLKIPADYYKVVSTATTLSDNVTMMKFLQTESNKHALVDYDGEQGIISRVLGCGREVLSLLARLMLS